MTTTQTPTRIRLTGLDRLRGLAIATMIVDHVALVAGVELLRVTVGRIALPLFFVVAGALVRRVTWRHGATFGIGLALPAVIPWLSYPNVLVSYTLGALLLVIARYVAGRPGVIVLLVVLLTAWANGWGGGFPGYPPAALIALMGVGALLGRDEVTKAGRAVPAWLEPVGRWPLTIYVGHLLVLHVAVVMVS